MFSKEGPVTFPPTKDALGTGDGITDISTINGEKESTSAPATDPLAGASVAADSPAAVASATESQATFSPDTTGAT